MLNMESDLVNMHAERIKPYNLMCTTIRYGIRYARQIGYVSQRIRTSSSRGGARSFLSHLN